MWELLRRVVRLGGVLGALYVTLVPVPAVVEVRVADFAALQARRPRGDDRARVPLEDFVRETPEGRTSDVAGPAWADLLAAATAAHAARPVPASFAARAGERHGERGIYLDPDDAPVADLRGALGPDASFRDASFRDASFRDASFRDASFRDASFRDASFRDAAVRDAAGRVTHLTLGWLRPDDRDTLAPGSLSCPHRRLALPMLAVACAVDARRPRTRRGPGIVRAHPVRAVLLPDVVGVLLAGVFAAMPMLVVPRMSASGRLFDGAWAGLTVVMAGMAMFGVVILFVAAGYAALRYEVQIDRIRRRSLFGREDGPFAEIVAVEPAVIRAPRGLVRMSFVAGLFRPAMMGQALILGRRSDPAGDVVLADGRRRRIVWTALADAAPLAHTLAPFLRPPPHRHPRRSG